MIVMRILFIGPIGSGKTTHARLLSQNLGIPLIQTGELARQRAQTGDQSGKSIGSLLQQGELLPDETMEGLVKEAVEKTGAGSYILDSYPRRLSQLNCFDPGIQKAVYLNVPDSEIEKRLALRGRNDDKPEIIEKRLRVYHQETAPLLDHYRRLGELIVVDATGPKQEVQQKIKDSLLSSLR